MSLMQSKLIAMNVFDEMAHQAGIIPGIMPDFPWHAGAAQVSQCGFDEHTGRLTP